MNIGSIGDGNSHPIPLNYDFATGNRVIIGQDPHFIMLSGIKRNHRPTSHPQELMDGKFGSSQKDRNFDLDCAELTHKLSFTVAVSGKALAIPV